MRKVFEASSGLEGHMIGNLLLQEGIENRVEGEYLQGGAGELQAINLVSVLVADSDYAKARSVIEDWESVEVEKSEVSSRARGVGASAWLLIGVMVGTGFAAWAYNSPITENGIDYNGDGRLDEKWIYRDGRLARVESDRNRDGKVDFIFFYDRRGVLHKSKSDDNFDGVYETKSRYRQGLIRRTDSDVNQDGEIDITYRFENDLLEEVEIVGPDPGSPRKRQVFHMGKLTSAEYDADGDGEFELAYEYDFYEEVKQQAHE